MGKRKPDYDTGDLLAMRIGKDEDPLIKKWGRAQSNVGDAIRFLIEEEIKGNNIRDLSEHISAKRPSLTEQLKKNPPSLLRN